MDVNCLSPGPAIHPLVDVKTKSAPFTVETTLASPRLLGRPNEVPAGMAVTGESDLGLAINTP
jgi:hypothetical protein